MKTIFTSVSDRDFFPGTIAAINSLLEFHENLSTKDIHIIYYFRKNDALEFLQVEHLQEAGITVHNSILFESWGVMGAWQLKTYSLKFLMDQCDVLVQFDSDMVFASSVDYEINQTFQTGTIQGGQDKSEQYGSEYAIYGIPAGSVNNTYVSTSCIFLPMTPDVKTAFSAAVLATQTAMYGPQTRKTHPGHGDQGVLNAVFHANKLPIAVLPNREWSQHHCFNQDIIALRDGVFINLSDGGLPMRTFHCSGTQKFWDKAHAKTRFTENSKPMWSTVHWYRSLFLGRLGKPRLYTQEHLAESFATFLPFISALEKHPRVISNLGISTMFVTNAGYKLKPHMKVLEISPTGPFTRALFHKFFFYGLNYHVLEDFERGGSYERLRETLPSQITIHPYHISNLREKNFDLIILNEDIDEATTFELQRHNPEADFLSV